MENRFNNRDFEQFVKQNADQYRMFPSEKVWDNIHTTLHVRRRWYGVGIALLLLVSVATVTLVMVNNSDKNQPIAQTLPPLANKSAELKTANQETYIAPVKASTRKTSSAAIAPGTEQPIVFLSDLSTQPFSAIEQTESPSLLADNNIVESTPAVSVRQPETGPIVSVVQKKDITVANNKPKQAQTVPAEPAKNMFVSVTDNNLTEPVVQPAEQKMIINRDPNLLTIESVINSYKNTGYSKKLSLLLSFTPTVSYRDLKENKGFIRGLQAGIATPVTNVYVPDINSIVTHKPDLGFQLGLTAGYPLSKRLTLTGGLQFTVSKYDIKAYSSPREQATIALSAENGGGSTTVSTFTSYRNIGGFRANWLRNLYVSASMPIGLELNLFSGKRGYIGVGSTVQPTYVLDNRSYLLSTDYKNYAEMPSLIRKWNINTSFEIFAANTSGKVKWRLGPQVRYQAMSSFKNKYPVKEHLFDFGLKLGVMLR